jgi:membrane-associated phospholipid phosphatase
MLKATLIFYLLSCFLCVTAQTDSLRDTVIQMRPADRTHKFRVRQAIAPVALITIGVFGVHNDWFIGQSKDLQEELQENIDKKFTVDDYMQYVPAASVYALNLCGLKSTHNYVDCTVVLAMSYLTMSIVTNTMKYTFREMRPDNSSRNSFPSGHTATAFAGAELLFQEYKSVSPWIGVAGFTAATFTGFMRMYNNRHYLNDVIAGAGIGIASVKLSYWLYPYIFKNKAHPSKKHSAKFIGAPYYNGEQLGCNAIITF